MTGVFVKIAKLSPIIYKNNSVELTLFKFEDINWGEKELKGSLSIDRIYAETQNVLTRFMQTNKVNNEYVLVEIEAVGLKASRCEGSVTNASKLLYPIPQPIRRIVFYKKNGEELSKIHEVNFPSGYWVYDGYLSTSNFDWDVMLIETSSGRRIISRRELLESSKVVTEGKTKKKKTRTRKSRKRKTKKKKTKVRRRRKPRST